LQTHLASNFFWQHPLENVKSLVQQGACVKDMSAFAKTVR
jgi:hypothetical protein